MIKTRKLLEENEMACLAPYAVLSSKSAGRKFYEDEDDYRLCFQKDKGRVIHSKAFRRLDKKTQVFIAGSGDHYRTRLTHTLEVAQISRSIARILGINEDLCEVIALAHDLGHPPFGHSGEEALNEAMSGFGLRFEHNEQSRRVVEYLEKTHPKHKGLNLSFEVIDGLLKHQTAFDNPGVKFDQSTHLEAQVVNLADEIAYTNHDIDDGLRSGIIKIEDLKTFQLWREADGFVKNKYGENLDEKIYISRVISSIMKLMIGNLCEQTEKNLASNNIQSLEDVKLIEFNIVCFDSEMLKKIKEIREFLLKNFYFSEKIQIFARNGKQKIRELFEFFVANPHKMDIELKKTDSFPEKIKDYIAGMTDNYLIYEHNRFLNN